MATIKDMAQAYESKQTKNIADLEVVSTDIEINGKNATDNEGKEFHYYYISVNNEEYRVPNSVLKSLKAILKKKPDLAKFAVSKEGVGFNTEYTVIPML